MSVSDEPKLVSDPEAAIEARLESVAERVGLVDLGDDNSDAGVLRVIAESVKKLGFGKGTSLFKDRRPRP